MDSCEKKQYEMLCAVVNFGTGSKIIKIARQNGLTGGTIFLGKGTANNYLLKLLDLSDIRKEIVLMISDASLVSQALTEINRKLELSRPNHGIAFTTSVANLLGIRKCEYHKNPEKRGENKAMYNAVIVVVEKGNAESVLNAAISAGSRGGTIVNARGSGIHETSKLFAMEIEPEKEIVIILTESMQTELVVSSINNYLKIEEPGNGILFVLDVNQACGLY